MITQSTGATVTTRVVAEDKRSRVERIDGGAVPLLQKTYTNSVSAMLRSLFRRSRAERECVNLQAMAAAGVPSVRAIEWSERRRFGCVSASVIVIEYLSDASDLGARLRSSQVPAERRGYAVALGRLVRGLHAANLRSTTLSLRNVLTVRDRDPLLLCDQPYAFRTENSWLQQLGARVDLYDTFFALSRLNDWSRTERWRGVLAYCDGDRGRGREVWTTMTRRRWWPGKWDRQSCRLLAAMLRARCTIEPRNTR